METSSAGLVRGFGLLGTQPADMTVSTRSIVEGIGVVGNVGTRQLAVLLDLFVHPLFLQAADERLGDVIVPTVALLAHAGLEVDRAAESSPRVAAVMSALIGVNQRAARSATAYGLLHGN